MTKPGWSQGACEPTNTVHRYAWHDQLAMGGNTWVKQREAEETLLAAEQGVADLVRRLDARTTVSDRLESSVESLAAQVEQLQREREEHAASVLPDDVGCVEYIKMLTAQIERLKTTAGCVLLAFHDWPQYNSTTANSERMGALNALAEEAGG